MITSREEVYRRAGIFNRFLDGELDTNDVRISTGEYPIDLITNKNYGKELGRIVCDLRGIPPEVLYEQFKERRRTNRNNNLRSMKRWV